MRKNHLVLVVVLLSSAACTKPTETGITIKSNPAKIKKSRLPGATLHWENALKDCITPAASCHTPIIVTAPRPDKFILLDDAINSGSDAILAFFNTDDALYFIPYFSNYYIDLLRSGEYTMLKELNSDMGREFYLIGHKDELSNENPEVVFPVQFQ